VERSGWGNFSGITQSPAIIYTLSMMTGCHHHGSSKEMMEWTNWLFLTLEPMDIPIQ